jgi:hypothetical protein
MSEPLNPIEIGRKANEMAAEFGLGAYREAIRRATTQPSQKDFWDAVAEHLSPHCSVRRRV